MLYVMQQRTIFRALYSTKDLLAVMKEKILSMFEAFSIFCLIFNYFIPLYLKSKYWFLTFDNTLSVLNSFKFRISASGVQISLRKLTSIGNDSSSLLPAVKHFTSIE